MHLWQETPFQPPATSATLWTGASAKGYGGWGHLDEDVAAPLDSLSGFWQDRHVSGEINVLELQAVILAVRMNHSKLAGRDVKRQKVRSSSARRRSAARLRRSWYCAAACPCGLGAATPFSDV